MRSFTFKIRAASVSRKGKYSFKAFFEQILYKSIFVQRAIVITTSNKSKQFTVDLSGRDRAKTEKTALFVFVFE